MGNGHKPATADIFNMDGRRSRKLFSPPTTKQAWLMQNAWRRVKQYRLVSGRRVCGTTRASFNMERRQRERIWASSQSNVKSYTKRAGNWSPSMRRRRAKPRLAYYSEFMNLQCFQNVAEVVFFFLSYTILKNKQWNKVSSLTTKARRLSGKNSDCFLLFCACVCVCVSSTGGASWYERSPLLLLKLEAGGGGGGGGGVVSWQPAKPTLPSAFCGMLAISWMRGRGQGSHWRETHSSEG